MDSTKDGWLSAGFRGIIGFLWLHICIDTQIGSKYPPTSLIHSVFNAQQPKLSSSRKVKTTSTQSPDDHKGYFSSSSYRHNKCNEKGRRVLLDSSKHDNKFDKLLIKSKSEFCCWCFRSYDLFVSIYEVNFVFCLNFLVEGCGCCGISSIHDASLLWMITGFNSL